jgi:hypothetical protein
MKCVRRIAHTEQLLKVSKRNPRFGRHPRRTEIRIGKARPCNSPWADAEASRSAGSD